MKRMSYSSEGIVLARRNYSEADRILVIFTKNFGKLSFLAKGVRKPKSRKRGHIEVFSHIRFSASQGKGLDLITETETISSYKVIRSSLKKVSVAYFLMEVVGRLSQEEEKNQEFYELILKNLELLCDTNSLKSLRKEFIYKSLVLLGFWPKQRMMGDADQALEEVLERKLSTIRVGRKLLT
ncbi:DNA repair protein RecO [Candidatus Woesebacteria bacterium RIFCSPLOWO2_01_FULL_39_10]|uniref:DNA repair protein RecO n=2 Tax=Candidatus Woeseibacteriota TaxID=1752722 RepID=A0A1F8B2V1_9BACT|nr:MAG: DNA repair protein RecO [Candidatus Woesebacteria bacterium RIFCSPLOWO2_01_FULL_39_10]